MAKVFIGQISHKKPRLAFGPYYREKPNAAFSRMLILWRFFALHLALRGVRLKHISEKTKRSILIVI
ncbi:hypothetical protein EG832_03920 [bacterium]|nr:hypothetical protein [bacterium]